MTKEQLLISAISVLSGVIVALVRALYCLYRQKVRREDQMIALVLKFSTNGGKDVENFLNLARKVQTMAIQKDDTKGYSN